MYVFTDILTQDNRVGRITRWLNMMQHVGCRHQPHLALAYCSLAPCQRESLLRAACQFHCQTAVEKRPALPITAHAYKARNGVHLPAGSHAHQQHNTMTRMAPNRTALEGHMDQCQCCPTCSNILNAGPSCCFCI